jgi:outer membrane protein
MELQKIAFLLFIICTISTFSQTENGKIFIGASSNLNASFINYSSKSDNSNGIDFGSSNSFSINPRVGYFIIDDFLIGFQASLSFNSFDRDGTSDSSSNSLSFAPFVRYYFLKGQFKPFINARYGFGSSESKFRNFDGLLDESRSTVRDLQVGGGVAYFINQTISLELGLNYIRSASKADNSPNNFKDINSGIFSSIGFAIFL